MTETILDFDLSGVPDDPNFIPDGKYRAKVSKIEVVHMKDTSKGKSLVFTYRVSEGEYQGTDLQEWKKANSFDSVRDKAFLKVRLKSLGVPDERLNTLTKDDIDGMLGTDVVITKKQNKQYANITEVVLDDGSVTVGGGNDSSATDLGLL